jgi:FtsP/CotA-like multicopper oxidase with cupredoxin domain
MMLLIAGGVVMAGIRQGSLVSTIMASAPQVREIELTAQEIDWEIMPGTTVRAWAYNGQMPGPEIRVREGDVVRITLRNELPVGTTIHWHGVNLPPEMDGPVGLNQAAVEPGEEFVYEFVAQPHGSRMYHSHADPTAQIALGLYGPLIVEPREPTRTYDREYTYMLNE